MKSNLSLDISRPLRIAYFTGSMKPGQDGVTRVLYRLIDALKYRGIENVFYSTILPPLAERSTQMVLVPSISVPIYKEYRFAYPGREYFAAHLSAFRPDLIHINSPCTLGYAAVQFGQDYDIPVVATYHTHFPSYAEYYKIHILENLSWSYLRKLYNDCQRVYVPTRPIMDELKNHGINNLKYLPHGVDTNLFHPRFRSDNWKDQIGISRKFALLYVGRLVWEKNLRMLADAYQRLQARRSDLAFILIGEGPIRNQLQQLMPQAIFVGYQSGLDLSTAYASSDLFVFPSVTETFGNVILEAMASGLVPVCTNQGGARGIVRSGVTGLFTRPQDPQDLADTIDYLLNHPELRARLAQQSIHYAREQTWEQIFTDMFADYTSIIQNFKTMKNTRKVA